MKQYKIAPIILALGLALTACGADTGTATDYSARQIAEVVIASQSELPSLHPLLPEEAEYEAHLANNYRLESTLLEEGAVYYAAGVEASEIAVFRITDDEDPVAAEAALNIYREHRAGVFTGYVPELAAQVERSLTVVNGDYVALLICADPQAARTAFLDCFSDTPPPLPDAALLPLARPEESAAPEAPPASPAGEYDPAAILAAWRGGGAPLDEMNQSILEACTETIGALIAAGMTDYEKELTIHDWIVEWCDYDRDAVDLAPGTSASPDSETPYGLLVNRKATCGGYASTFQLFMDLLEVECVTVEGLAREGTSAHAWNMVRLNGEWYCVDVTWNDPVDADSSDPRIGRKYFNVTSAFLRENDHQWQEAETPPATAEDRGA